jgi:hydrogenase nickel incorporation protein HypA/HybF
MAGNEQGTMHELSLATEIYRACRSRMAAGEPGRLERVKVAVGELSAVEPDLLRFAWEALTAGGADAGATLEIDWRAAKQVCEDCGEVAERAPGSWLPLCPRCGRPLRVEGGGELDLLQFSYLPIPRHQESPG